PPMAAMVATMATKNDTSLWRAGPLVAVVTAPPSPRLAGRVETDGSLTDSTATKHDATRQPLTAAAGRSSQGASMRDRRPSRTAEHNALFRALETSLPEDRRLFRDPLARAMLTWPLSLVGQLASVPPFRAFALWFIDHRWPGVRTSVVARTRLIDDTTARWLGERCHPSPAPQMEIALVARCTNDLAAHPTAACMRRRSRPFQDSRPWPLAAESVTISRCGFTRRAWARHCSTSKSRCGRRSTLLSTITSLARNMWGYFSGLSSPSVTDMITTLVCSPRSQRAGR